MKRILSIWLASSVLAGAQWLNYPTAGIPHARDGKPDMTAAVPKTSAGKPDLSGIWEAEDQTYFRDLADGLKPEDVVLTPWAQAIQKQREERDHVDDPLGPRRDPV
jgi:hypothetical protein